MCESAATLQDLCMECIGDCMEEVFDSVYLQDGSAGPVQFEFKDPDIRLHAELAEKLLLKFDEKEIVNDATLSLFTWSNTKLRSVKIRDSNVTRNGLKVLGQHKLEELHCVNCRSVSLSQMLDCLSEFSTVNLTTLNVSRCTFWDSTLEDLAGQLTKLKNLRSLNVSFTDFDQQMLLEVCDELCLLEALDISATNVYCIQPLLLLRLTSLNASDLKLIYAMTDTILELSSLKHLDISLTYGMYDNIQYAAVNDVLSHPEKLPDLESLEISGWQVPMSTLEPFLDAHPKLKYLGVMLNPVASETCFTELCRERKVTVAGFGSEEQLMNTLRIHKDRIPYIHKALHWLLTLPENSLATNNNELIELVVSVMTGKTRDYDVQCTGICCLHKLIHEAPKECISVSVLSRAMHVILNAMSYHSNHGELQETALRLLYNDWLLRNIAFNKLRCAVLVMESFNRFGEDTDCISVVICDILTHLMSSEQVMLFGSDTAYMCKFLLIIRERIDRHNCDLVMRVVITMLANLTDEKPRTAAVFLDNGGAQLCLRLLETFCDERDVVQSVLLVLSNTVESAGLHCKLMLEPLVRKLVELMGGRDTYSGYFAAGIVAHLASAGDDGWTVKECPREDVLWALEQAMGEWDISQKLWVSYNSVRPFLTLLQVEVDHRVQMWSLWAIQRMCIENPKRYFELLNKERAVSYLENLLDDRNCNRAVRSICLKLKQALEATCN